MSIKPKLRDITARIAERSIETRTDYLDRMKKARDAGTRRAHLSCGNQAHAYAAMGGDKNDLVNARQPNVGIISAYNDLLSAHQPFERFPQIIKDAAREHGGTAQFAGGVPAMCDGVTQGQAGMDLSLFSRDVIALSAGVALSHNTFDTTVYLGVCDKIVPGLIMAAATFGYLPAIFLPAGPMPSGISNDEKSKIRQKFAAGECGRDELMAVEMESYHGPGTCTFYGTANTNQMLMEFMGLHLPGSSFVPPNTPLRDALTRVGAKRALEITALGNDYRPVAEILDERAFVNGIVGLMATGGSTNLAIHLIAMARTAGILLDIEDLGDLSDITPLLARVYPNGLADVNHFHAAGGLSFLISELLSDGLLHGDTVTVSGNGLADYASDPKYVGDRVQWEPTDGKSQNEKILRSLDDPFAGQGGLKSLEGNLGRAVIKISAVAEERHVIEAPAAIFTTQEAVKEAFQNKRLDRDVIVVVRGQGPSANGMPELHGLTPILATLQDRGHKVALVTDGRMSGASGKVPAAIHLAPEAVHGGAIAKLRDGDMLRLDAKSGLLTCLEQGFEARPTVEVDVSHSQFGTGRELFQSFRNMVGPADQGAAVVV